jgi:hypothetical protein
MVFGLIGLILSLSLESTKNIINQKKINFFHFQIIFNIYKKV